MSVLLDTSVLAGAWLGRQATHPAALRALGLASRGTWGPAWLTDDILDEAVTLVRARSRSHALADDLAAAALGAPPHPRRWGLIRVEPAEFDLARALFRSYADRPLSLTDCTSLAVMRTRGIRSIATFDRGFEGLVHRIDPGDEASLAAGP